MELIEAIKTRRSIRKYKTTPVDDQDINIILEAARWAPSWANTQCCRLIVVRDQKIKLRLAETLKSPRADGKNPSTEAFSDAPVIVVGCAELGKSGFKGGEATTDKGDWFMFDVALAMQNLVLAAHSLGLGTVFVGLFDAQEVTEILNLPEGIAVVAMTPLGYPEAEGKVPPRKELTEIVFYDCYGNTSS